MIGRTRADAAGGSGRATVEGPFDVVARDEAVATGAGDRREVDAVLLRVEANGRRRARREADRRASGDGAAGRSASGCDGRR